MLKRIKSKREQGFTIIEVLIVLAIAGLILLVVFLAVPALQRNSRNTAIKSDVQNLLGSVSEFQSNNNGKMPTAIAGTGDVVLSGATGTTSLTAKLRGSTVVSAVTSAPTSVPIGEARVWIGHTCPNGSNQTSSRAVCVFYSTEGSGDPILQQQES